MKALPQVTLIAIDTVKYGDTINALYKSLEQIQPAETIWFTDIFLNQAFKLQEIKHLYSKQEYSHFCIKELGKYPFTTSHILITQWDGYVLDGEQWNDEWLQYDYLGAPWLWDDGMNVGNGGFSLRSVRLHQILATDKFIGGYHQEDATIGRTYRPYLEDKYGIKFAPEEVAHKFSYELHEPKQPTFGFHGDFHPPYKEPIVIRRSGALGDVIQLEPLMHHLWQKGHKVILDSPFFQIFSRHHFPIHDYSKFDHEVIKHRVIDMNTAYECNPRQLHLKSYFEIAGITDYVLRNPKLNYQVNDSNRIFKRYVVLHIDERETEHRNIHGVNWAQVIEFIQGQGYEVIQIGQGPHEEVALHFNTVNTLMLSWLMAGASAFLGCDSGPANVAVALGVPAIISFGSVNPEFIHADLSNITVLQSKCPANTPNCWHLTTSKRGQDCSVHPLVPPCTVLNTQTVINAISARFLVTETAVNK